MKQAVRQTRTHIGELLARHNVHPRHNLGQNFLIDLNLLEFLVAEADLGPDDVVLEVGTGTGGLTAFLAERAGTIVAVEIDPRMKELTAEAVDGFSNVTLLGCDVLHNKNHFAPEVLAALDAALSLPPDRDEHQTPAAQRGLKLVANLPYCVATPVISNLVASSYHWDRMTVTIQLELAQRMMAREKTADYSALSVWLQSQSRIELLKRLPAEVFWPRPKVESAMIRIVPDPLLRDAIRDRSFLHDFLRAIFQQRRKLLRNVLNAVIRGDLSRPEIDEVVRSQGIAEQARAEELAPAKLVSLCNAFVDTLQQVRGAGHRSSPTE